VESPWGNSLRPNFGTSDATVGGSPKRSAQRLRGQTALWLYRAIGDVMPKDCP
jgi:hypothetical protein